MRNVSKDHMFNLCFPFQYYHDFNTHVFLFYDYVVRFTHVRFQSLLERLVNSHIKGKNNVALKSCSNTCIIVETDEEATFFSVTQCSFLRHN
jgi:hypothetical protein